MNLRNRGFTILELIVVVAIIGILTAVILLSINKSQAKGRDAKRDRDMHEIRSALNLYITEEGVYPNDGTGDEIIIDGTDYLTADLESEGHLSVVPIDPIQSESEDLVYTYQPLNNNRSFLLSYCYESREGCPEIRP